ncbi:MAG: site-specific integrase [Burkholderiaceae bacterium]|nr:MAG: site-specific integrase [Burkholderiaceae bacterium]
MPRAPMMNESASLPHLPLRAGHLSAGDLIDLYMAHYAGRDSTRVQRLTWWKSKLGAIALQDVTDDHVHAAIEDLAMQHSRYFAGKDADARPIYRAKRKPLAPATLNRYLQALAAVITWCIRKRIAPKGYVHPCRSVEKRPERNERVRFLSDDERTGLLAACKASSWPRLYVLVLMALTTGARKGELLGLRWADVDLQRAEASVGSTKNGDPRVLPLVPAVVADLQKFKAGATALVFGSPRRPGKAYHFEPLYLQALQAAHIRGVTFHTLRHSCASMLARNGATLLEIGDLLGHRQMQMTKRYSHLATQHKAALVKRVLGDVA